ncbi:hypothetical protein MferCBS31731_002625 [Microsporum ferrugineum]
MQITAAVISLLVANVAAIAAPDPATKALLSLREGTEVGFVPGLTLDSRGDGYHNYCDAPCVGTVCVQGANPQCCYNNGVCGCCWYIDDPAYLAKTKPADNLSKNRGSTNTPAGNRVSDSLASQRRPQAQYRVGGKK